MCCVCVCECHCVNVNDCVIVSVRPVLRRFIEPLSISLDLTISRAGESSVQPLLLILFLLYYNRIRPVTSFIMSYANRDCPVQFGHTSMLVLFSLLLLLLLLFECFVLTFRNELMEAGNWPRTDEGVHGTCSARGWAKEKSKM